MQQNFYRVSFGVPETLADKCKDILNILFSILLIAICFFAIIGLLLSFIYGCCYWFNLLF